mmetsp:Transcript_45673/g.145811  ORF Transcript_45673/g.145811 Transcript_45673/m.145811 type:complete len:212 (-) Transcript_45673:229-864(-)
MALLMSAAWADCPCLCLRSLLSTRSTHCMARPQCMRHCSRCSWTCPGAWWYGLAGHSSRCWHSCICAATAATTCPLPALLQSTSGHWSWASGRSGPRHSLAQARTSCAVSAAGSRAAQGPWLAQVLRPRPAPMPCLCCAPWPRSSLAPMRTLGLPRRRRFSSCKASTASPSSPWRTCTPPWSQSGRSTACCTQPHCSWERRRCPSSSGSSL